MEYSIGDIVYMPYKPQRYGKIIDELSRKQGAEYWETPPFFKVRWRDNTISVESERMLNSFEKLVTDTERKAANHRRNFEKAKEL